MKVHSKVVAVSLVVALAAACSDEAEAPGATASAGGDPTIAQAPAAIDGKKIYGEFCFSCHTPGLSGAPKLGDVEGWAPRIAKGPALLLQTTIDGIAPAMPPRGLCMSCTDEELEAAIAYMIAESS